MQKCRGQKRKYGSANKQNNGPDARHRAGQWKVGPGDAEGQKRQDRIVGNPVSRRAREPAAGASIGVN